MIARAHAGADVRLLSPQDAPVFPHHADAIPPGTIDAGAYQLRFAWNRSDLHAVQALRYRVFNEELGEGLLESGHSGRDEDARDPWFHHLMICHRESGEVVGTYRLQTAVMAATRFGFYSATLFELGAIPGAILDGAVEIGRACVASEHRSGRVLRMLWKGLARYLQWNSKRYLFGCCSLAGTAADTASEAWRALHARDAMHERVLVKPRPHVSALPDDGRNRPVFEADALASPLPPLFEGYLSLGAKVCGAPATDYEFGTIDFLVLLDINELDRRTYQSLFG
jgi:putative hemolysin